jgi:thiol-disulfide isomerase/thioredoxin
MPIRRLVSHLLFAVVGVAAAGTPLVAATAVTPPVPAPAATTAPARPDLVRLVRLKLSAADLASAEAWTEDWRRDYGKDATWLDARGWLARGAWMLGDKDRALALAREVRAAIPEPGPELLIPLGAALEVEGKIVAERQGGAAAVRFFGEAQKLSTDAAFRARMWKNVNRLELVGRPAPALGAADHVGPTPPALAELRGRPVLLFFWNYRCGDCKASAPTLARLHELYAPRGLVIVAPTRLWGGTKDDGSVVTAEEEKADIARTLAAGYPGLPDLPVPVDTDTMIRYGASATPTFVLLDRGGVVRLYSPTRLTVAALSAAIEPLLAAKP